MVSLFFIVVLVLLSFLIWDMIKANQREKLIERLSYGLSQQEVEEASLWDGAANLLQLESIRNLLYSSYITRKFDLMIKRSQLNVTLPKAILVFLFSSAIPAIPAYLYWKTTVALVISLLLLPFILWFLLSWKSSSMQKKLDGQLPSLISSFLTTLGAGGTPIQALQSVSKNSPEPIASSISGILESIRLGRSPQMAWQEWADFWGTTSSKLLATGIKIKWETGGQMSAILSHILETLEFNRRMELRVSTLTAQSKLSAWVLSLLPVALGALVKAFRPDLFDAMVNDEIGQKMLIAAAVLTVLGFFTLQRMAKLKS